MEVIPFFGQLRPQLVLAIFGLLAIFGTGQFMKVLNSRVGMCFAAFTAWFLACVPFGAWPGGSFHVFLEQWYKAAAYFYAIGRAVDDPAPSQPALSCHCLCHWHFGQFTFLKNNRPRTDA